MWKGFASAVREKTAATSPLPPPRAQIASIGRRQVLGRHVLHLRHLPLHFCCSGRRHGHLAFIKYLLN